MSRLHLTQERYIEALQRQRRRILSGEVSLSGHDDETPGCKSTECSWGLCSGEKAAWPDAQDHIWPDQFEQSGRVAPLYRRPGQPCPLDQRESNGPSGCFWGCMFFQGDSRKLTQEKVIQLYDKRIAEAVLKAVNDFREAHEAKARQEWHERHGIPLEE
jgi:hypothetical protein